MPDTPPQDSPKDPPTLVKTGSTLRDQAATIDLPAPMLELPPSSLFEGGRLVLLPRMIEIPPVPTLLLLLLGNVAMVLFPSLIVGRLRDQALDTKRAHVALLARLRQLVPDEARSTP